jgi:hypothetical protein
VSNAWAAVKFEDGQILYAIYYGTADVMYETLWPTIKDAWGAPGFSEDTDPPSTDEPVLIYSDYGGGHHWSGRADRQSMRLTAGFSPYEAEDHQWGLPDWLWPNGTLRTVRESK